MPRLFAFSLLILLAAGPASALRAADALPVMATLSSGQRNPGFLVGAEPDGLIISTAPVGGNTAKVLFSNIADLNVEEPKGWGSAEIQLNAGNYAEAEKAFAKLADDYAALIPWKDGYGSIARLNHFKTLKAQGKLKELAAAMDRQLAKPLALGALHKIDFDDLRGWAILGKGDMQALQFYLNEFQEPVNKWGLQPLFKPGLPGRIHASLAYLRGHLNDKAGKTDLALIDYHTAMTWNNGSDRILFGLACLDALKIAAAKTAAKPDDLALKKSAHFLAVTYRDLVGKGKVPGEFNALLAPIPEDKPASEAPSAPAEEKKASE